MAVYNAKYDLNKDGNVDQLDMDIFQRYFGTLVDVSDPLSKQCDFNNDGVIDEIDYSGLVRNATPPPVATKPSLLKAVAPALVIGSLFVGAIIFGRKQ
ncbi:MAG: dockerin type I domain-containing protein [Chloroflexota bacterium]